MLRKLLFPARCCGCGIIVKEEGSVCQRCRKQLRFIREPICIRCGKTVAEQGQTFCYDCGKREHYFVQNRGLFEYSDLMKKMIYALKYQHNRDAGIFLGKELAGGYGGYLRALKLDGIVPVPLAEKRLRERGYNQAAVIAEEIGRQCGIPVYPNYLQRSRSTRPQKELNDIGRKNNVKNAFHIRKNEVQLNQILLVDDIYTTGATLDEAARCLRMAGAEAVYGLTACIGRGF